MVLHLGMRKDLGRHAISQALVGSLVVVEEEICLQTPLQGGDRLVFSEINILIFDTAPQPLDEDIVETPTATIHADADIGILQATGESQGGELGALVGIEQLRSAHLERPMQRVQLAHFHFQTKGMEAHESLFYSGNGWRNSWPQAHMSEM